MLKSRYYKILGLPNNATQTEIRKKYRKLVMQYHPDRNDSIQAQEKFIAIKEAYEILMGKKAAPMVKGSNGAYRDPAVKEAEEQRLREQRAREGQIRFKQQQEDQHAENERYYQNLTNGIKWKTIRFSAILGIILSFMILSDYVLPHHFKEDKVNGYSLNYAHGLGGAQISLIRTESENTYWVEHINYELYGKNQLIYVESSWFFHNPIRIIAKGKLEFSYYDVNFSWYTISWLLFILFLVPAFTRYYKRKKVTFTVLYHFSYYGINALMLVYLISGNRWAHVLTFGVL